MRIISLLIIILTISSCVFPEVGVNKFAKIYKGMDMYKIRGLIKESPANTGSFDFYNENILYEVYDIKLSTYTEEREEYRPSYLYRDAYDKYEVTTTTDYFYPFIILFKNKKVFFQGFIWEYKNNENPEINEIGDILWSKIYVY